MGWLLLDIAVILILVIPCIRMAKKGVIRVIFNLTANIIAVILVSVSLEPATEMVVNSALGERLSESISESISNKTPELSGKTSTFEFMPKVQRDLVKKGLENTEENINKEITGFIIRTITSVVLFIIVRLLMSLILILIESVFKMPVLSKMNIITGGIVGLINGLLIVYIASAVIGLNFKWAEDIRLCIDDTFIYQHFYYNNVLIDLFIN